MEVMGTKAEDLKHVALAAQEQALLENIAASSKEEWFLRLWCVKEAVAKALGEGMAGSPLNLLIEKIEIETGLVAVRLNGELAQRRLEFAAATIVAHTGREGEMVFASTAV